MVVINQQLKRRRGEKVNKRIIMIFAITASITMGLTSHVSAASKDNSSSINQKINETDTAIELPGGGFLIGQGEFKGKDAQGNQFIIDPETTSYKVTTVKEAQKDQKNELLKTNTKNPLLESKVYLPTGDPSASPITKPATQSVITLNANQGYSGTMSGNKWRYAKYWFSPADNTGGPYLRWESHGDSGLVITPWSGEGQGTVINDGQAKYIAGPYITNQTSFSSHSPVKYSYYYVGNW